MTTSVVQITVQQGGLALTLAIISLVISVAAVAAQGVLYWLNGSRVHLDLRMSTLLTGGMVSNKPETLLKQMPQLLAQGAGALYLTVKVTNRGRSATRVTGFGARFDNGASYLPPPDGLSPELPHELEPHSQASFYVPWAVLTATSRAFDATSKLRRDHHYVQMVVDFGNGKRRVTKDKAVIT